MRSKAPLALIELSVMLLVLLVAIAFCLQAFVWADATAKQNADAGSAMILLQNAAEALKHCGGDYDKASGIFGGSWDGTCWTVTQGAFVLQAVPVETGGLWGCSLLEVTMDGVTLGQLRVCWQEVAHEA